MAKTFGKPWNVCLPSRSRKLTPRLALIAALAAMVIASRLAHLDLVWIEEAYGMAAASEILRGKHLYADIWFDKPPLYAWFYVLSGGMAGWPLRIAGIVLVAASAGSAALLAREWWGAREALAAAALMCFSLTFWIHSAVIAVAPDLLLLVPHMLAVLFAARRNPFVAGLCAGVALLCNSKGLVIAAVIVVWCWRDVLMVLAGFALPQAAGLLMWPPAEYWQQVWSWGFRYSADTFVQTPLREGLSRTLAWAGFHASVVIAAGVCFAREFAWRRALWFALSFASVFAGWRFFPRYYFVLLPVVVVCASRGLFLLSVRCRTIVLSLLLIPAIRFGPRYAQLDGWSDVALMEDSRRTAKSLRGLARPGDELLVWGYRPDIFVFSGMPAGTRFLDSQPLNGVLADRHLMTARPTLADVGARNRAELRRSHPAFVVDGLGPLNPDLGIGQQQDLRAWFSSYEPVARTRTAVVYRLRSYLNP